MNEQRQEQSDDAISREAVLTLYDIYFGFFSSNIPGEKESLKDKIKAIPPATPQQRTGWWIPRNAFLLKYKCSECGWESEKYNYCPNCGAKMEIKECENCKHYGEDLHGANCRFCQDKKLWEVKENG